MRAPAKHMQERVTAEGWQRCRSPANDALHATPNYVRALWKWWTRYHAQSRLDAKMRFLYAFGERIAARDTDRQKPYPHRLHEVLPPWQRRCNKTRVHGIGHLKFSYMTVPRTAVRGLKCYSYLRPTHAGRAGLRIGRPKPDTCTFTRRRPMTRPFSLTTTSML